MARLDRRQWPERLIDQDLRIDAVLDLARERVGDDAVREGESADYINFYLDELDESELSAIIDISNKSRSVELQLLDKLILANIWIYPDTENNFGVFHYSIELDGEPCNQLLTILTNEYGELNDITWES